MPLAVLFSDRRVGERCNSGAALDEAWGVAALDVRVSLSVLSESSDIDAFGRLPNVSNEGDLTVFKGSVADVVLDLTPTGPPPGVTVHRIDVRDQRGER
jgi:hypothetical protein